MNINDFNIIVIPAIYGRIDTHQSKAVAAQEV